MKKKFSLFGKTLMTLFLTCLVSGSVFADVKNFTTSVTNPSGNSIYTNDDEAEFTIIGNYAEECATLDPTKVYLATTEETPSVVMVVNTCEAQYDANKKLTGYKVTFKYDATNHNYFSGKTSAVKDVKVYFEAGAWSVTKSSKTYTNSAEAADNENGMYVYDEPAILWGTPTNESGKRINENDKVIKVTLSATGKHATKANLGITLTTKTTTLTGKAVTGAEYKDDQALSFTLSTLSSVAATETTPAYTYFTATTNANLVESNADGYTLAIPEKYGTLTYAEGDTKEIPAKDLTVHVVPAIKSISAPDGTSNIQNFDQADHKFSFTVTANVEDENRTPINDLAVNLYTVSGTTKTLISGLKVSDGDTESSISAADFDFTVTNGEAGNEKIITAEFKKYTDGDNKGQYMKGFTADNNITVTIPAGAFTANDQTYVVDKDDDTKNIVKAILSATTASITLGNIEDFSDEAEYIYVPVTAKAGNLDLTPAMNVTDVLVKVGTASYKSTPAVMEGSKVKIKVPSYTKPLGSVSVLFQEGDVRANVNNTESTKNNAVTKSGAAKPVVTFPTALVADDFNIDNTATEIKLSYPLSYKNQEVSAIEDSKVTAVSSNITITNIDDQTSITEAKWSADVLTIKLSKALSADYHTFTIKPAAISVSGAYNENPEDDMTLQFEVADHINFTATAAAKTMDKLVFKLTAKESTTGTDVTDNIDLNSVSWVIIGGTSYLATNNGKDEIYVAITSGNENPVGNVYDAISMTKVAGKTLSFTIPANYIHNSLTFNSAISGTITTTNFTHSGHQSVTTCDKIKTYYIALTSSCSNTKYDIADDTKLALKNVDGTTDIDVESYKMSDDSVTIEVTTVDPLEITAKDKYYHLVLSPGAVVAKQGSINLATYDYVFDASAVFEFVDSTVATKESPVTASVATKVYDHAILNRKFKSTKLQPYYMPFDIPVAQLNKEGLTIYRIISTSEGTDPETLAEISKFLVEEFTPEIYNKKVYFTKDEIKNAKEGDSAYGKTTDDINEAKSVKGMVYAYMPYIVKADAENSTKRVVLTNVQGYASCPNGRGSVKSQSTLETYTFTGNQEAKAAGDLNGKFYLNSGVLTKEGADATAYAWRWYMETSNTGISYAKIVVDGEDENATAIESVNAENNTNVANDAIYNIAGQRISQMSKGINIVNGKKVLVK